MTIAHAHLAAVCRRMSAGPARLSFAQQQLWLSSHLLDRGSLFNIPVAFEVSGALDLASFARALTEIVRRHEALRTSFVVADDGPRQVVMPPGAVPIALADLQHLQHAGARAVAERAVRQMAAAAFHVDRAPLMRSVVFRISPRSSIVALVVHHLVFDGWSAGILLHEIEVLYEAFARGLPSPFADLPFQYADYAEWQRQQEDGSRWMRAVAYWTSQIQRPAATLDALFDRVGGAERSYDTGSTPIACDEPTTEALTRWCRRQGVTAFAAAVAAFATVLHRFTGHTAFTIGTYAASRREPTLTSVIGFFVNTLPLRVDLSGDPTWSELAARVRDACFEAFDYDDLPFEQIVEAARRTGAVPQVIQAVVSLKTFPKASAGRRGSSLQVTPLSIGTASQFPLWLSLDISTRLTGSLKYHRELFDATTICRIADAFQCALRSAVADEHRRVSTLDIESDTEPAMLRDGTCESPTWSPATTVDRLISQQALMTPERVAIVCGDRHLTYRALLARAQAIAAALGERRVGPEMRVAVCLEPSIEMVAALLGIMIVGAAYVPLDPLHPAHRLATIIEDAQPDVVVTDPGCAGRMPPTAAAVMCVDAAPPDVGDKTIASRPHPRNLCYILYTSGSTGRPKGVLVEHRSVVNLLLGFRDSTRVDARDVIVATTTLTFDIAALELFLPLVVGARLVVAQTSVKHDAGALGALFAEQGATIAQATPTQWRMHVDADWACPPTAWCGGERLPRELADTLLARSASVWNLYGPTETTIWSSAHPLSATDAGEPSIGRPLANTSFAVVNRSGQRVPIGIRGELHIGGEGVARGYWRRPGLTAAHFVPDPFSGAPGARLYRTGDIVRCRQDGSFSYVGRDDLQIKLRGTRVEIGDVEAALRRCARVEAAAACVRKTPQGDDQLVAYVVSGSTIALDDCRRELKAYLPAAFVPHQLVQIPALPLTLNGKVDRRSLPSPPYDVPAAARTGSNTETTATVAGIWSSLLGRERVDAHEDFFALGGDSLLGTRMLARIRKAFDITIPLRALFDNATLAEFITIVDAQIQRSRAGRSADTS